MAGSKKVPETIKASFELHSDEEIMTMKELYAETNLNSKTALFSVSRSEEEKAKKLSALYNLVGSLKVQLGKTYVRKTPPEIIPTAREEELIPLVKLIAKFGRDSQRHHYHSQSLDKQKEIRQAILNGLLTLSNEQLDQLIPLAKHIGKLEEFKQGALFNTEATFGGLGPLLNELLIIEDKTNKEEALDKLHKEREELLLNIEELSRKREKLPVKLAFYKAELAKTNPASFPFLSEEQKARLKNKLLFTYFLLYSTYQLDEAEGRGYTLGDHQAALDLCSQRIQELDLNPARGEEFNYENALEAEINLFTKALKFLGITILAAWIVEKITQFMDKKTVLKDWMSEINGKRLYWVWGGGMLSAALELMLKKGIDTTLAQDRLSTPSPYTGYMSWVLYFCRLGVNLLLLFKHTIKGPWMSEAESKIPAWERFKTQWDQRKFGILNDIFWAPINMITFFWLKGPGTLGYAGNVVTFVLLAMDLAFTIWRHWEESTKHEAEMEALRQDREALAEQIRIHQSIDISVMTEEAKAAWKTKLANLQEQRKELNKMEAKARFDWKYKELGLCNDIVYSFALLLSFAVVVCFFFPPATLAPLTVLIIGLCGALACFVATTIYSAINSHLERSKTKEQGEITKLECAELLAAFKKEENPELKKQLYLEMKGLMAESEYQERLAKFQLGKAIASVLIDVVFPAIVFSSILFLPTGLAIGPIIGIIAAVMVITWFCNNIIIKNFEPKPNEQPQFDEVEYDAFVELFTENPELTFDEAASHLAPPKKAEAPSSQRFFSRTAPTEGYQRLRQVDEEDDNEQFDGPLIS